MAKLYIDILLEIDTLITKSLEIQNKRVIKKCKRSLFIADIQSIEEGLYLSEDKTEYLYCVNVIMNSGEVIKTSEKYKELNKIFIEFWKKQQELDEAENEE